MSEEEARKLREENAALKRELAQKDSRIAELEARLMAAVLRIVKVTFGSCDFLVIPPNIHERWSNF